MAHLKFTRLTDRLRQKGMVLFQRVDQRSHGWLNVFVRAFSDTFKPFSTISAAAISYFTLFSIFPLILLSISIASYNISPLMGWEFVINIYEYIAPGLSQLLGKNIASVIEMRGPVTGIALAGLIWSASTVFYTLTQTLNDIWGRKRSRAVWKRRGVAILLVLVIAGPLLFLASLASSLMDILRAWVPEPLRFVSPGVTIIIAIVLDIFLLLVLYLILPHGKSIWHEQLPGAISAGILWELAKKGFLLFTSTYVDASNLIYGSVATIIAFLTWAYLSGLILLFGAYLNLAYVKNKLGELGTTRQPQIGDQGSA